MELAEGGKSSKILVLMAIVGAFVLMIHFTFTGLFSFREFVSPSMKTMADRYAFPVFHQDWSLFAPNVAKYNSELEYRFAYHGKWSNWSDVSNGQGYETVSRMERIEQGFNHQLAWQATNNLYSDNGITKYDRIMRSPAYKNALYYAVRMHERHQSNLAYDSMQVRISFRFTPENGRANDVDITHLEFPAYLPETKH